MLYYESIPKLLKHRNLDKSSKVVCQDEFPSTSFNQDIKVLLVIK